MTPERVSAIIEAYGASPARWPAAERDDALALIAEQPERFATAQAAEAELDALLGSGSMQPSDLLERRIMRALPEPRSTGWNWRAPAAAAAAVLLAVSVGVGSGVFTPVEEPSIEELYADALYSYGMDWTSLYSGEET